MTPDRITLQNMEKKPNESFRQYAQKWREIATQVYPPLLEKETTILFINTLNAPFINLMLESVTKSFSDVVMTGEMIENTIRWGKIEVGESAKRSNPRKRENDVSNVIVHNNSYSKPVTMSQTRTITTSHQGPPRQESNARQRTEKPYFTSIPMTYRELYQNLFDAHVVSPFYLKTIQPPYPKWYYANAQYEYYAGITGYSIENCTAFKILDERLIDMGIVKYDDLSGAENSLPNHVDKGVNAIANNEARKIKENTAKVKTPLKEVWKEMVKRGLIASDLEDKSQEAIDYCIFHDEEGHVIQECAEFRALAQGLMDNKEVEFFEYAEENDASETGAQGTPKVKIQKHVAFPYKDSKRVPWNYDYNVTFLKEEGPVCTSEEDKDVGFYTRSGKHYDTQNSRIEPINGKSLAVEQRKEKLELLATELVTGREAKEFLKFLKHSEYSVVEQLHNQPLAYQYWFYS
ncbi:uncharacterized protein [Gossypium hirsutum]|uniref:Uncharacterized protein n=1 Tax=Gossypium hirsutum TaxID=3635 RepID=A0ABM3AD52_GOSHI|nr:uncharacterized protein LOC121219143 [Gossypium hirsutum]